MSQDVIRRCDFRIRGGHKCGQVVPNNEQTVFSLNEDAYLDDLCDEHKLRLAEVLAPFIAIADAGFTQVGAAVRKALLQSGGGMTTEADIRAWARENGYQVGQFGRIAADVQAAYHASQAGK